MVETTADGDPFSTSLFSQLKAYEAKRRSAYSTKLDSTSLHWKSYLDLMGAALRETGRAQRLVLGTCRAHQLYANAMQGISHDVYWDENGKVATEKQRKRLQTSRATRSPDAVSSLSALTKLQETQESLAGQWEENAKNMDEEIADAVTTLLEEVSQTFVRLQELGNAIVQELEKTESEVTAAWNKYLSGQSEPATSPTSQASSTTSSPTNGNSSVADTWIVEMQYRAAVAYQNQAWQRVHGHWDSEVLRQIQQEEIRRRVHLRELLVAFVQRQQRLFGNVPGIQTSVLEALVGGTNELDRNEIEKNLKAALGEAIQCWKDENGSSISSPPLVESPITSELLSNAKVVQRRGRYSGVASSATSTAAGGNADWLLSLAVVTSDSYLHFFDVGQGQSSVGSTSLPTSRLSLASSVESLFQTLLPQVRVPTAENVQMGKSNFSRGWSESLVPSDSLILAKCLVQKHSYRDDGEDSCSLTIIEKGGGGGGGSNRNLQSSNAASKLMFGKLLDKKIQVRFPDESALEDWIQVLTSATTATA